ncbi:hypothetical protein EAG_02753 [Camponotus floridanus]|uniref:Uncharacterized protein n=1 Tax=Camponotus floridanus TaxID=104421 RepID=E2AF76_CAMFO|nr:hypothetical protein EAG_02753 [Camponotus floridanus]
MRNGREGERTRKTGTSQREDGMRGIEKHRNRRKKKRRKVEEGRRREKAGEERWRIRIMGQKLAKQEGLEKEEKVKQEGWKRDRKGEGEEGQTQEKEEEEEGQGTAKRRGLDGKEGCRGMKRGEGRREGKGRVRGLLPGENRVATCAAVYNSLVAASSLGRLLSVRRTNFDQDSPNSDDNGMGPRGPRVPRRFSAHLVDFPEKGIVSPPSSKLELLDGVALTQGSRIEDDGISAVFSSDSAG